MIEIFNRSNKLIIQDSQKSEISFDETTLNVELDWFNVTYPWEYEKSGILLEVKEFENILFYNFLIEKKHIVIITNDKFELKEEILSFFWDVDTLIIIWTKDAAKVFENIEANVVIPYWETKDIFLNTLWQHNEEVDSYKVKSEFTFESTEFVNLKIK
jgi:hypothetical protein